jgi:hypothetical protein
MNNVILVISLEILIQTSEVWSPITYLTTPIILSLLTCIDVLGHDEQSQGYLFMVMKFGFSILLPMLVPSHWWLIATAKGFDIGWTIYTLKEGGMDKLYCEGGQSTLIVLIAVVMDYNFKRYFGAEN